MAKKVQSQWDFGELFPPEATRKVLTVSELTGEVRRLLERQIGSVWVTGEISNFRAQSSGHIYFTLKDAGSQLNCVLFRGEKVEGRNLLQDGQKVVLQGDLTVYEPRGQYQMVVRVVELQGVGALQIAFEKLKQKLNAEGLFAPERKRPLPRCPQRIGLVTSPTGAAIRDVLHVIERRNPGLEIILAPCRVQGTGAAREIADAIRALNDWAKAAPGNQLDLILVTRGGGSLEDLWAFNEEIVARAISESEVPVVSAVGHEIDFSISDFVADLRAATPSAAAEIITDGVHASREFVAGAVELLQRRLRQRLRTEQVNARHLAERLMQAHPRRRVQEQFQRLDDLQLTMSRQVKYRLRDAEQTAAAAVQRLLRLRPSQILERHGETLSRLEARLIELARQRWRGAKDRLAAAESRLRLLSPEHVLARGYSITMNAETGAVIRSAEKVASGSRIKTRLHKGELRSVVEEEPGRRLPGG